MLNSFDIFVIIMISIGVVRGFFKGFIKEAASIAGVAAGFYGAYTYHKAFFEYIQSLLLKWELWELELNQWEGYGNIICFFILFFTIAAISGMSAHIISKFLKIVFLGWVDKLFGIIFGAAKGFIVVSIVFIVLTKFLPFQPEFMTDSIFIPYIAQYSDIIEVFLSKQLRNENLITF